MRIKLLVLALMCGVSLLAAADPSSTSLIHNQVIGSGEQQLGVTEGQVVHPEFGLYHSPNFLPYFPTAATLWPSIVEVPCVKKSNGLLLCDSFNWTPAFGRGEYVYIKPVLKQTVAPTVIIREVPIKKGKE